MGSTAALGTTTTTLAQRQVQLQQLDQQLQRRLADSRRREEQLRAENRRLQRENTAVQARDGPTSNTGEDEEMEEDDVQEIGDDERRRRIDETRAGIPYLVTKYGEESDQVAAARAELSTLERAARDAKPYKTHRSQLERRKARLERQQERGKQEADDLLTKIETLQSRLNAVNKANDEREAAIQATDTELRELLRKAIADGEDGNAGAGAPQVDPGAAWNTVTSTIEAMVNMPGVPRDWAVQLGSLVETLRSATIAVQERAAAAAVAAAAGPTTSSTSSSPSPPSAAVTASSAQPATQLVAAAVQQPAPLAPQPAPAQQQQQQQQQQQGWENRALELAFSDGHVAGAAGATAGAAAATDGGSGPTDEGGDKPGTGEAAQALAAACNGTASGGESETEDDDMESVFEGVFSLREGETEPQRKSRIATYLRARDQARKERRRREGATGRKTRDAQANGNGSKPASRPKPIHGKK